MIAVKTAPAKIPSRGLKAGHQADKCLGIPQGNHSGAHHIHTDEQYAKARHDLTDGVEFGIFKKYNQHHAGKGNQRRQHSHIQRDQKAGDGGADIGAHDNPDCLSQCHHTGIDKPHDHNGGGRG